MAIGGVAMIVLGVVIAMSYGGQALTTRGDFGGYRLYALFNRVDGLNEGAPVYLSGIDVGRVDRMLLEPNYRARVTMAMKPGVDLPTDTAAAIHTDGLFGSKFVSLDPGGSPEMLKDGDTITFTQDALIVTQLLDLIISQGRAARGQDSAGTADEGKKEADGAAPPLPTLQGEGR